jgi:dolichyl-phosphate beta-glucosyltransferase
LAGKQQDDGFAFDVEYLYILKLNGLTVKEVPCDWSDDPDSSIAHPLKTSFHFYKEMKAIKKRKEHYLFSTDEKKELANNVLTKTEEK